MKKIPLTQGKFALVDDEDFEYLSQWKWYFMSIGYAGRNIKKPDGKRTVVYMHHSIRSSKNGLETDHINRNRLDNRKSNLRLIKHGENTINRGIQKNNSSGYKGVYWHSGRWVAEIKKNYKKHYIGSFKKVADAVLAREKFKNLLYPGI